MGNFVGSRATVYMQGSLWLAQQLPFCINNYWDHKPIYKLVSELSALTSLTTMTHNTCFTECPTAEWSRYQLLGYSRWHLLVATRLLAYSQGQLWPAGETPVVTQPSSYPSDSWPWDLFVTYPGICTSFADRCPSTCLAEDWDVTCHLTWDMISCLGT